MEVATTFFKTSSQPFPGDALKKLLRRLKMFWRLFLVKAKDHLETIHERSIYVRFRLQTCYHSIIRHHYCINLNKLITLKYENNVEMMKTWFSMKCQTRNYFFQELKYFLAMEFYIQSLYKPITPEVYEKDVNKKT